MKRALFVGSFNPITIAHELIAKDLIKDKIINDLYFLPVESNKSDLINITKRIDMINLIISKHEEVINIYDFSKTGLFNHSILDKINKYLSITHIVMGSDLFLKFKTFSNWKKIISNYYLIIINRNFKTNDYVEKNYKDYLDKIIIVNKNYDGSSKKAKEQLLDKNNIYLNKKVLDYIKKNNLYN